MARRNQYRPRPKTQPKARTTPLERPAAVPVERKPPTQYGKPFALLEDTNKVTYEFRAGSWVRYSMTIAECRRECQVRELPQKINNMTRYEVRSPLP